ncbi:hypothetical protein [Humidisolicoccus flavus]|uniref:hypothetical protein n=1 Tax=Humidisolicoccus flavus TaxID=3111414 RepID=UPI003248F7FA
MRFGEVRPRAGTLLLAGAQTVTISAIIASAVVFLFAVFLGVAAEEIAMSVWRDFDVEPIFRSLVAFTCLLGISAGLIEAIRVEFGRWSSLRDLERHLAEHSDIVPVQHERNVLKTTPGTGLFVFAWIAIGVGVLGLILGIFFLVDEPGSSDTPWVFLISFGLIALGFGMIQIVSVLRRRWNARVHVVASRANQKVAAARRAETAKAAGIPVGALPGERAVQVARSVLKPCLRIASSVFGLSTIGMIIALFLRQPCRNCEQLTWGSFGESAVDTITLIAWITAIASLVVIAILSLGMVVVRTVERSILRSNAARRPNERRPEDTVLVPQLFRAGASGVASGVLGFSASTAVIIGLALLLPDVALEIQYDRFGALPTLMFQGAAVLFVVSFVLTILSRREQFRFNETTRLAWAPGDAHPKQSVEANGSAPESDERGFPRNKDQS